MGRSTKLSGPQNQSCYWLITNTHNIILRYPVSWHSIDKWAYFVLYYNKRRPCWLYEGYTISVAFVVHHSMNNNCSSDETCISFSYHKIWDTCLSIVCLFHWIKDVIYHCISSNNWWDTNLYITYHLYLCQGVTQFDALNVSPRTRCIVYWVIFRKMITWCFANSEVFTLWVT